MKIENIRFTTHKLDPNDCGGYFRCMRMDIDGGNGYSIQRLGLRRWFCEGFPVEKADEGLIKELAVNILKRAIEVGL